MWIKKSLTDTNIDSNIEQIFSKKSKKKIEETLCNTVENDNEEVKNEEVEEIKKEEIELKDRLKLSDKDFTLQYYGEEGRPFHLGLPFKKENTQFRHFFMKLKGQRAGQIHVGPEHGDTIIDNRTVVNFSKLKINFPTAYLSGFFL